MEPTRGENGEFLRPIIFQSGHIVAEIEEARDVDGRIWPALRLYRLNAEFGKELKLDDRFTLADSEHLARVTAHAKSFMLKHFVAVHQPRYDDLSEKDKKLLASDFEFDSCPTCQWSDGYVNIWAPGKEIQHWGICHVHKCRWYLGTELFTSRRHEAVSQWGHNELVIGQYEIIRAAPAAPEFRPGKKNSGRQKTI